MFKGFAHEEQCDMGQGSSPSVYNKATVDEV